MTVETRAVELVGLEIEEVERDVQALRSCIKGLKKSLAEKEKEAKRLQKLIAHLRETIQIQWQFVDNMTCRAKSVSEEVYQWVVNSMDIDYNYVGEFPEVEEYRGI